MNNQNLTIIGSGPAGLSLACQLNHPNIQINIIEKKTENTLSQPKDDGREIALTHRSKNILEALNIWQKIPTNQISRIEQAKVLDGKSPYTLDFQSPKTQSTALGFLIANHIIKKMLYQKAKQQNNINWLTNQAIKNINIESEKAYIKLNSEQTLETHLVISADGRQSQTKQMLGISSSIYDFGRTVIVCRMTCEKPHQHIAYECFHYDRTLAILPLLNNQVSIIITLPSDQAKMLMQMKTDPFSQDVQKRFNNQLGVMKIIGQRHSYPLFATYANQFIKNRFALLGDSAVGMHPVTAHGFNLSLQGSKTLAQTIEKALLKERDIGAYTSLLEYQKKHNTESKPIYLGTNAIVKLYTNNRFIAKVIRTGMLRFANHFPPIKKRIINQLTQIN